MLNGKAEEVIHAAEEICKVLANDKQALWAVLHRSTQHKMDYHLSLSYPSDIHEAADYLDRALFEKTAGQLIPRREGGRGYECVLNIPVSSMADISFQELLARTPVRLQGFGLWWRAQRLPLSGR